MTNLILSLSVATLTAFIWLSWYRGKELEHPRQRSPRWVYAYFLAGIVAALAIVFMPWYFDVPVPGHPDGFLAMLYGAGIPEEAVKFLAFYLLARKEKLREPFDIISRGALVGLGFAILENLLYGQTFGLKIALGRAFLTPQAHMIYTAIAAAGWGITRLDRELRRERGWQGLPLLGYGVAAIFHAVNNVVAGGFLMVILDLSSLILLVLAIVRLGERSPYKRWEASEAGEALAAIDRALLEEGRNAGLLYRRGLYSLASGLWTEACVYFDGAAATASAESARAMLRSWYATALYALGEREEGKAIFDDAWPRLSPQERNAFYKTLARMMPARKAFRAEIRDITRALAWMPERLAAAPRMAS